MAQASPEERAWNAIKDANDPEWAVIPNHEFKSKLRFAASRVKETGLAESPFEKKVLEFRLQDSAEEEETPAEEPAEAPEETESPETAPAEAPETAPETPAAAAA